MFPKSTLHQIASEHLSDLNACGLFIENRFQFFPSENKQVNNIYNAVFSSNLKESILQSFQGFPLLIGVRRHKLPVGLTMKYLSLDKLMGFPSGIFCIESLDSTFFETLNRLIQSSSRKDKKLLTSIKKSISRWKNPNISHLDSKVDGFQKEITREVIAYRDDTIERTIEKYQDFVSSFSHEALGPIQEIRNGVEYVLGKSNHTEDISSTLETSLQATSRLRTALEGMRLLFEAGSEPLENQFLNVNILEMVDRWSQIFKEQAEEKSILITVFPRKYDWIVKGIPAALEVMIRNLISNGVKYSFTGYQRPGGRTFKISFDARNSQLSFENYGIPIPSEEIQSDTLFKRGIRGSFSDDRGRKGKGVGLYLVKKVADMHKAKIHVESEIQTPGSINQIARTEFRITFTKNI